MTAYTLAADANLRQIGTAGIWGVATARTGGDTVDTNGFKLTIDQDSRYGLRGTTSTTWGSLTLTAGKGGEIHIDGTKVWMIPFTGGSGTLTLGAEITIGGVTCNTIGIYTSLTVAPANTGASGWLKVTNASGVPGAISSGTYAGFTLTANGAAIRGFIEVNGDEAGTINANRLGTFRVTGEWFTLGTTSGSSNQTLQCPNNGTLRYLAGVYIEKTAGQGDYEFWPNNGVNTTTGTEATRGKVVWIDNTGLVRIGNSGAATNGYTPPAGLAVVVPNIFFENNTTAARTANVIPNATIATRYDFTTTGGGVLEIDKGNFAWYLSVSQAYSVNISNSGFVDGISLSEIASPLTFNKVGVGNKPTTALLMSPLTMTYCPAGGTFTDCVWLRASMAASGAHTVTLSDIAGFTFVRDKIVAGVIRANATTFSVNATRIQNCTWTTPTIIQGAMSFTTCTNITVTDTIYCEAVSGTTVTTYTGYVWMVTTTTINAVFSGLTLPVTNTQPYTALLSCAVASAKIKLRNIGTRTSPLTMGSTNGCGYVYTLASAAQDIKVQRVYVSNTRSGTMTADNSCTRVTEENFYGDYADAPVAAALNLRRKGCGCAAATTAQVSVYGTHWYDHFTSATVGKLVIMMNEPSTESSSYVTLTGGAKFNSSGGLYMPTIGMTATFEMDYAAIGHTAHSSTAVVMGGGAVGNHRFEYSIDLMNGAGFSAMTNASYTAATLATALSAITLDASKGFKLKIKITTAVTNTAAFNSLTFTTVSKASAQDYQYPLDTNTLTLTGIVAGTDVVILSAGTETVLATSDDQPGSTFAYTYSGTQNVDICLYKPGYIPSFVRSLPLTLTDSTLPMTQTIDPSYLE